MAAAHKLDHYASRLSFGDDINWEQYEIPANEAAKIRQAGSYQDALKDAFLNGEMVDGLSLPWAKANEFHFRNGEMTVWTGYSGHKKSMMLGQVMIGLIAQGARACIASLEMKPVKSLKRMVRQYVGVEEPTLRYQADMFNWLSSNLWFYDQVGTVDPNRMIAVARYAVTELGLGHIVIDSLMKCGIDEDDYNKQKWFVNELHTLAQDYNCHVHLVSHQRKPHDGKEYEPGEKYGVAGSGNITNQPDNVLVVYWNKKKEEALAKGEEVDENDADAYLLCKKQREGESEPVYKLFFDEKCLQFKGWKNAMKLGPDEWKQARWQ